MPLSLNDQVGTVGDVTDAGAGGFFEYLFKRLASIRIYRHNKPAGRFGKQQDVVTQALIAGNTLSDLPVNLECPPIDTMARCTASPPR